MRPSFDLGNLDTAISRALQRVRRFGILCTPPLIVANNAQTEHAPTTTAHTAPNANTNAQPAPAYGLDGTAEERPTDPNEIISICGARTKKGTPCQRRVRGTGRCWQHLGKPAMLPPEKLIIQGGE